MIWAVLLAVLGAGVLARSSTIPRSDLSEDMEVVGIAFLLAVGLVTALEVLG